MNISNYIAICDALSLLFKPLVEVVIHDIKTTKIIYIAGNLSKRKIGDPSLIDLGMDKIEHEIELITYPKISFDKSLIKSITVQLKEGDQVKALLCINCDVSIFSQMQTLSKEFIQVTKENQPKSLFKNDWQECINIAISQELQDRKWQFNSLAIKQKKELVHQLFIAGAFAEKNAADYIATILDMGRATLFKYLKEWRS